MNTHDKYGEITTKLIQDIFDVHRAFIFCNYHFEQYSTKKFQTDILNNAKDYLGIDFLNQNILNDNIKLNTKFKFFPQYIIDDDIFEIFQYIFEVTKYVITTKFK